VNERKHIGRTRSLIINVRVLKLIWLKKTMVGKRGHDMSEIDMVRLIYGGERDMMIE